MVACFATIASLFALATSANALLALPYRKCDTSSGCTTRSTTIIMEGAGQNYAAQQVYTFGSDGLLLTAPISRSYVVAPNGTSYEMFYLKNRQISIDIDISKVQCGYNAAFYFSSMSQRSAIGYGYCDAQGTWCNEMDIFEGNYGAMAVASHSCSHSTGTCDPWGCSANTYYQNVAVGPGLTIDTRRKFTLTTKFYTNTGTDAGTLNRIVQVYSQDGRSVTTSNLDESYCSSGYYWQVSGGFPAMSRAFEIGQVMIFSFWGTGGNGMSWLDGGAASNPRCSAASTSVNQVTFGNVVVNYIDGVAPPSGATTTTTTTRTTTTTTRTTTTTSSSPTSSSGCSAKWGQCGGIGWTGPKCCVSSTCTYNNDWYSQCL